MSADVNNSSFQNKAADLHKNIPPDWYVRSIKENFLQRFWHNTRFREVGKLIEPTGGRVLDIGSADGTFTKIILDKSKADKVMGIDVLAGSVSFAKRRFARSKKMSFRIADAHNLPFENKTFDVVSCLETMEHVEDPSQVISEIHRVLKDLGYALILIPAENILFRFFVWPLWTIWRGRIWKGTHLHQFRADHILGLLENGGFRVVRNEKFLLGMLQAVKVNKK